MADCAADRELQWLTRIILDEKARRANGCRLNFERVIKAANAAAAWKDSGPYCRCEGKVKRPCK